MATQLLAFDEAHGLNIALGGGLREFYGADKNGKRRTADDDLVSSWLAGDDDRVFIRTADELAGLDPEKRILGLFSSSHMEYIGRRRADTSQPMLQDMTRAAIRHLEAQGTGYYLMIEGGRIDHGHHDGYPGLAMLEAQAFAEAVQIAIDSVDLDETLVMVTADHSHVMSIGGYPTRGNPILGHVVGNDDNGEPMKKPKLASDGQPYTTIGYANGPFAIVEGPRPTPETGIHARAQALYRIDYVDLDGIEYSSESHGGEDVVLYATGRGSDCVAGVIEQNRIYDYITAAFGWRAPVCAD
jgi:alkaline phosphatase